MGETYSEQFIDWLVDEGYDTCFFLAGGNIMHLLNAARSRLRCIPVVHEVAAGIAAEYYNAARPSGSPKAFAMVTAGPGVTNVLTALAGAFLESRDLLVVAGQVKASDLAVAPGLRQRGIQEVDGPALVAPVCKAVLRITEPLSRQEVLAAIRLGSRDRMGPTFIEVCLDAQAAPGLQGKLPASSYEPVPLAAPSDAVAEAVARLERSERPLLLIGGGVSRDLARELLPTLTSLGVPIATTWNALDRIGADHPLYFGRPDTWGMRWSNILMQQADLLIAVGARLSLQQTGFNWQAFAPLAQIIHVDIDEAELAKPHPAKHQGIHASASSFLRLLVASATMRPEWAEWIRFGQEVRGLLTLDDSGNETADGYLSPYAFTAALSDVLASDDVIVPCSSGGASTVLMQAFEQKTGQTVLNNKALASMGYGLSGAIGASLANPGHRVILIEGDGGFAQNSQELGTVRVNNLPIKMFIFENRGYASIRMTQRNHFGGAHVGCDEATGVGLPDWRALASAYGLSSTILDPAEPFSTRTLSLLVAEEPALFVVPLDPEQTYFPKISSRITSTGGMESNPLHQMTPELDPTLAYRVMPYLRGSFL